MGTRSVQLAGVAVRVAWGHPCWRFPGAMLHTLPSRGEGSGDPGRPRGLWIAWKGSSGLPEAWKLFSLLLTASTQIPLGLSLLSLLVTFPLEWRWELPVVVG